MSAEKTLNAAGRAFGQFGEVLHKGKELRNEADERAVEFSQAGDKAQHELNVAAVQTGSIYLAGWRPALGWLCVIVLSYNLLIHPVLSAWLPINAAPTEVVMGLLPVLLGATAMRTYEKMKGVQTHTMMSPREKRRWWKRDK